MTYIYRVATGTRLEDGSGTTELRSGTLIDIVTEQNISFIHITVQPRYNAPLYSAVFNITRPCHGSQNDYFAVCLL